MRPLRDGALDARIAQLDGLGLHDLRKVWRQHLGAPPRVASAELTRRWLSWELQARVQGGLDLATRRRIRQLGKAFKTNPADAVAPRATLKPGTVLTREWNGATHRVMVLEQGFAWNGQQYGSLSEIAFGITGTRWSGPRFFGLRQRDKS
jgi:hypothetical protein